LICSTTSSAFFFGGRPRFAGANEGLVFFAVAFLGAVVFLATVFFLGVLLCVIKETLVDYFDRQWKVPPIHTIFLLSCLYAGKISRFYFKD
jgi:hypothetical protein